MVVGRCNPCPIALGGNTDSAWTAAQHARAAADIVALTRGMPFARLTLTQGAATAVVDAYTAQHGRGLGVAPTAVWVANGQVKLTWDASYADEYGTAYPVNLRAGKGTVHYVSGPRPLTFDFTKPNEINVYCHIMSSGVADNRKWSIAVW